MLKMETLEMANICRFADLDVNLYGIGEDLLIPNRQQKIVCVCLLRMCFVVVNNIIIKIISYINFETCERR